MTQNYEKYPIYSEWKIKEKSIKKILKLTNSELESLNTNEDVLIRMFAEEIIIELNNEEILPSWFIKAYLEKELNLDLKTIDDELKDFVDNNNNKINNQLSNIDYYNTKIEQYKKILIKYQNKKNKIELKLNKISNSKYNIFKSIFSLGLYNYLISNKRKNKINLKLVSYNNSIVELNKNIFDNNNKKIECRESIKKYKLGINEKKENTKIKKITSLDNYKKKLSEVRPLLNIIPHDESFTMLKFLSGLEYEKIIGVYVIHNKEKDKYYVGQSKDVMKRIRQHFNGTTPKNIIFAEDYYNSQIENRDNIFEVKIIRCKTKDELDFIEKKLIYEYDALNNGYNSTSGNA